MMGCAFEIQRRCSHDIFVATIMAELHQVTVMPSVILNSRFTTATACQAASLETWKTSNAMIGAPLKSGLQPSRGQAGACKPEEEGGGDQQVKQGWVWEGGVAQGCGAAPGGGPSPCHCPLQAQTCKTTVA